MSHILRTVISGDIVATFYGFAQKTIHFYLPE